MYFKQPPACKAAAQCTLAKVLLGLVVPCFTCTMYVGQGATRVFLLEAASGAHIVFAGEYQINAEKSEA